MKFKFLKEKNKIDNEDNFEGEVNDEQSFLKQGKTSDENSINQRNVMEFQKIVDNCVPKKENYYWDRNNLFMKIILFLIWTTAIFGTLYYIVLWFSNN